MSEEPKIIIDSDWKQQAQAEKAKLAAQAKDREQARQAAAGPAGASPDDPNRPIDFDDLIRTLASQALMYLGAFPDESGRAMLAPEMAKAYIDMLAVLETKTKGNLTPEEDSALKGVLNELRLQFVEISKAIAKAIQEGKIKPQGAPGSPVVPPTGGPSLRP
ncbi:MAG: DUF1844 domain-containing protein [Phycisphaeraceae bacterium]|nr:DUF1844 domain-containing protein [Phycisphaeraceae bacterium]MCW5754646.1 DUF1844 domain-containing protein [Phycisphaeraceae bacterium]